MTKQLIPTILLGILAGCAVTVAGFLTAKAAVKPVPLKQVDTPFSRNVDLPGNSREPVFYLQFEIDGHIAYFSCVKHEPILVPGVIPK